VIVLQEHTPGTPHHGGTLLENSGTPWGVQYTQLTSTGLNLLNIVQKIWALQKTLRPCGVPSWLHSWLTLTRNRGGDCPTLKYAKVTSFTIILYNLENNIRDTRPFCHPLFCHSSSVVKYHLSYSVEPVMRLDCPTNSTETAPLTLLDGSALSLTRSFPKSMVIPQGKASCQCFRHQFSDGFLLQLYQFEANEFQILSVRETSCDIVL